MAVVVADIVDCYVFRRGAGEAEFLQLLRAAAAYLGGTWHAVHGHIDPGETALRAALRELREETALSPLRCWQLEHVNTFYQANRDAVVMCPCFAVEVAAGALPVLSAEHTEYRWVLQRQAAAHFLWPGQQAAIREILCVILAGAPAELLLRQPLA